MSATSRGSSDPETVADLMKRDVVTIAPEASIRDLAQTLLRHEISGVPVVEAGGTVIGSISITDLVWLGDSLGKGADDPRVSPRHGELDRRTVYDIMSPDVFGVPPDTSLEELGCFFSRTGLHRALVLEEGRLQGIVSFTDLLRWILLEPAAG